MRHVAAVAAVVLAVGSGAVLSAEDQVARGKQLYDEQKCRMCHSLGGAGNSKGAVLDGVGTRLGPDDLRKWLTDPKEMAQKAGSTRKPPMKSFATLPPPDIDALVAYLSSLK